MTEASSLAVILGGSASQYDCAHVDALVETIANVAGSYAGGRLCLHGMTLPFANPAEAHAGYMEFQISKADLEPIAFGVEFGSRADLPRLGFKPKTIAQLQLAAGPGDAVNGMATVLNFDELWLFANRLVQRLSVSEISLAFGGLGGL